jgi:tRNA(fMet)-specific endonuclease VapC
MVSNISWVLDTNILSEAMRPSPDAAVMACLARYDGELAIPAPVWHELRFGWLRMPDGQRKDAIGQYVQTVLVALPVLPYDASAARIHAELRSTGERSGHCLPFVDGQIAAIAMSHGLTLVTRNTKDFANIQGLRLENWFATRSASAS